MKRVSLLCTTALVGVLVGSSPANADTVLETSDYGQIQQGDVVEGFDMQSHDLIGMVGATGETRSFGSLSSRVLHDADQEGGYIYEYTVSPASDLTDTLSSFRANFDVGATALYDQGWDHEAVGEAGGLGTVDDFQVTLTSGLSALRWTTKREQGAEWAWEDEALTFFFRTETAPGTNGRFQLNGDGSGYAIGYAPAPVPSAGLAAVPVLGVLGLGYAVRQRRSRRFAN